MTEVLIATLAFYLLQLMLPSVMALARGEVDAAFLFSSRDQQGERSPIVRRAQRSCVNMQESLIVFLPLMGIAMVSGTNIAETATIWLGLRIAYLITYLMAVSYVRTFIWLGSVYFLSVMAFALV